MAPRRELTGFLGEVGRLLLLMTVLGLGVWAVIVVVEWIKKAVTS
jgi:hypothetical protein